MAEEAVWQLVQQTVKSLGGVQTPPQVPGKYSQIIQRFVEPVQPQDNIFFVFNDKDGNLLIENELVNDPTLPVVLKVRQYQQEQSVSYGQQQVNGDPEEVIEDEDKPKPPVKPQVVEEEERTDEILQGSIFFFVRTKTFSKSILKDLSKQIHSGVISPNIVDELRNLMISVFTPWIKQSSWAPNIKDDFQCQLERYLATVTELAFLQRGRTVLFVPQLEKMDPVEASRNKELIPRLESLVVHWTRQIKEMITGIHYSQNVQEKTEGIDDFNYYKFSLLPNPLTEINYWKKRNEDLSAIGEQLNSSTLEDIIQTLKYAHSHYASQFSELKEQIIVRTKEASENLGELVKIEPMCLQLSMASEPEAIIRILPSLLDEVKIISQNSEFYKKESNLSALLRTVANAVVNAAATYIQLIDIFEGDALNSVHRLLQCKQLFQFFIELYQSKCGETGGWIYDSSVIASCDAFSQRCLDLCEVCQDRLQFKRPETLLKCQKGALERLSKNSGKSDDKQFAKSMELLRSAGQVLDEENAGTSFNKDYQTGNYMMPKYIGSQDNTVRKSLEDMKEKYDSYLQVLRSVRYNQLDVKASSWHEDIAAYRTSVKELIVFVENIMKNTFQQVKHSVVDSCHILEAFDHLASRPAFQRSVQKQQLDTIIQFTDQVNQLKARFEGLRQGNQQEDEQQHQQAVAIPLNMVLASQSFMPGYGGQAVQLRRLLANLEENWHAICFWLPPQCKQIAYDMLLKLRGKNEIEIEALKQLGRDDQEAVEVYVRTKELFESYIEKCKQDWKRQALEPDYDYLLEKVPIMKLERIQGVEEIKQDRDYNSAGQPVPQLNLILLNNQLAVHFPKEVDLATNEFAYWQEFLNDNDTDMDQVAMLYDRRSKLHQIKETVNLCVREINSVAKNLNTKEINLFKSRLSILADTVRPAYESIGWNTKNIQTLIQSYRKIAVEALQLTQTFHSKSYVVDQSIEQLAAVQLIVLRDPGQKITQSITLGEFMSKQLIQRSKSLKQIEQILNNLYTALTACYEIFRLDGKDVQQEWIKYVDAVDLRIEKAFQKMFLNNLEDFAFQLTGKRQLPSDLVNLKHDIPSVFRLQVLIQPNVGIMLKPSAEDLNSGIRSCLQFLCTDLIPNIPRLGLSLTEKEAEMRAKKIREAEALVQEKIHEKEREGLAISEQDMIEIRKPLDEWLNLVPPRYHISEPYSQKFDYLIQVVYDKCDLQSVQIQQAQIQQQQTTNQQFTGLDPVQALVLQEQLQIQQQQQQLKSVIYWINHYVDRSCAECVNMANSYNVYEILWREKPERYEESQKLLANFNKDTYELQIRQFQELAAQIQTKESFKPTRIINLDFSKAKEDLIKISQEFQRQLIKKLQDSAFGSLTSVSEELRRIVTDLGKTIRTTEDYQRQKQNLEDSRQYLEKIQEVILPIHKKIDLLQAFETEIPPDKIQEFNNLTKLIQDARGSVEAGAANLNKEKLKFKEQLQMDQSNLMASTINILSSINAEGPMKVNIVSKEGPLTHDDCHQAKVIIDRFRKKYEQLIDVKQKVEADMDLFAIDFREPKELSMINSLLNLFTTIWDISQDWQQFWDKQQNLQLVDIHGEQIEEYIKRMSSQVKKVSKEEAKNWEITIYMSKRCEEFKHIPALIQDLQNPAMRQRHWIQISEVSGIYLEKPTANPDIKTKSDLDGKDPAFTLSFIVESNMQVNSEMINQISGGATMELKIEEGVNKIKETWSQVQFVVSSYQSKGIGGQAQTHATIQHYILKSTEDIFKALEENTLEISSMKGSKFAKSFEQQLDCWENMLTQVQDSIELILQTQRAWQYLENIFAASEDIRKQLPAEAREFDEANELWRRSMTNLYKKLYVLQCFDVIDVLDSKISLRKSSTIVKTMLEIMLILDGVQKKLEEYLEFKRSQFPRFYFLSNEELLEILAQSRDPFAVQPHIKKCFDCMKKLEMKNNNGQITASGMHGLCGEFVPFIKNINCNTSVEVWLNGVEDVMRLTLRDMAPRCYADLMAAKLPLSIFLAKWPGALCIAAEQIKWSQMVQAALNSGQVELDKFKEQLLEMEEGTQNPGLSACCEMVRKSLKATRKKSIMFLTELTEIMRNKQESNVPKEAPFPMNFEPKLIANKTRTHITLEVHNRDIVEELYHARPQNDKCFEWFSQLKFSMETQTLPSLIPGGQPQIIKVIMMKQASTSLPYQYEYQNNSGRLVITALTDRCYMTITSSISIQKGTLPQGPAGTGKTETVKDLSKALGIICVVFNCSDGLDFKSMGRLFSGLCQAGAWSCFDEFNRLLPDVLSVVAQQINNILSAVSKGLDKFVFEGRTIPLNRNCYINITMNPGYAGRSELPENLQQLFRPISMVVPDMKLIAEVQIFSEGFVSARILGQKLTSLFALCNLQLSKQSHYDWTLRSLKAILLAAGALRRQYSNLAEDAILMRAMQFSTEPKLIKPDLPLFRGLVGDLFPGLELSEITYGLLEAGIDMEFYIRNLKYNPKQKEKILQLYEAKAARHGVMLIGKSGGSKTIAYEVLGSAEIRAYKAFVESCDSKAPLHNPYCVILKHAIDSGELRNLTGFLKAIYKDTNNTFKTVGDHNIFVKCVHFMRETYDITSQRLTNQSLQEPIYDANSMTLNDCQFPITIKFMNPKSLNLNQLYGATDPNTQEWTDGIVSNILRQSSIDSAFGTPFKTSYSDFTLEKFQKISQEMGTALQNTKSTEYQFLLNKKKNFDELTSFNHFWVMYDGPVDTLWIESQNSVLDDSKVLTLVNGERIAFPNQISMLFEANDLDVASPATVSRCGQCYFDLNDVQWNWQYEQWIENSYKNQLLVQNVPVECQLQIVEVLENYGFKVFKKLFNLKEEEQINQAIPQADYAIVRMFICLFEVLATESNGLKFVVGEEAQNMRLLEMFVIFCVVWSFGGSLTPEGRKVLDTAVREIDGSVPVSDTVFEYKVDGSRKQWVHWNESVNKSWRPQPGVPLYAVIVPTVDTVRTEYMIKTMMLTSNLHYLQQRYFKSLANTNNYVSNYGTMLFGVSGTGKTGIVKNIVIPAFETSNITVSAFEQYNGLSLVTSDKPTDAEKYYVQGTLGKYSSVQLGMSAQTTPERIKAVIESRLQPRSQISMGPVGGKRLMSFFDDFNMPQLDCYGSQTPLEIIKQYIERGSWYRLKKDKYYLSQVIDVDILTAMATPGGGRNQISGRILSKFNVLAIDNPSDQILKQIFVTLMQIHFQTFDDSIKQLLEPSVNSGIDIYNTICQSLLPTPAKPFYIFNLRDLSKFFMGMMKADPKQQSQAESFIRLWTHECMRVFQDRMLPQDASWFSDVINSKLSQYFNTTLNRVFVNKEPPVFVDFLEFDDVQVPYGKEGDTKEVGVFQESIERSSLRKHVEQCLDRYNTDSGAASMNLVVFADALDHICRIARVISQPNGHALLIGTGGSGRQSLSRLAAFIQQQKVFTIDVGKGYKLSNFKNSMKDLYIMAGGDKGQPTTFLLTDNQISDEAFLEDINSILSSGEIPGLFTNEDLQGIRDMMSPLAKLVMGSETMDSCYQLLIRRAKENLHIVLAFSPSHEKFRTRLRMFPGLISSCTIDLFGQWPLSALEEVGQHFMHEFVLFNEYNIQDLQEWEQTQTNLQASARKKREKLSLRIAHAFTSIFDVAVQTNQAMVSATGRKLFLTPANYLYMCRLYKTILIKQKEKITKNMKKLQGGVGTLVDTGEIVSAMEVTLKAKQAEVDRLKEECEIKTENLGASKQAANLKKATVEDMQEKMAKEKVLIDKDVAEITILQRNAEPAFMQAKKALDSLDESMVAEAKSYQKLGAEMMLLYSAVMVLLGKSQSLASIKTELAKQTFLGSLKNYNMNGVTPGMMNTLRKYYENEKFTVKAQSSVSAACGNLCNWVRSMYEFTQQRFIFEPLTEELARKEEKRARAEEQIASMNRELAELNNAIDKMENELANELAKKDKLNRDAIQLQIKRDRAVELIQGLSSENDRWTKKIADYQVELKMLPGDCIYATAFLSYSGGLTGTYRKDMMHKWIQIVQSYSIPTSVKELTKDITLKESFQFNVVNFLSGAATAFEWTTQGLPSDTFSAENGVLILESDLRCPFIIDPQRQASRWLKKKIASDPKIAENYKFLNVKDADYLKVIQLAVQFGQTVVLEDVSENLDPSLDPIVQKQVIKKQGRLVIKIGENEVEWNDNFKIFLCTRLNNPALTPELFAKCTIINFSVVKEGLTDQLLAQIVQKEKPDVEKQKNDIVLNTARMKNEIQENEDAILTQLSQAEPSKILEDEVLIKKLKDSQLASAEIARSLETQVVTERKIDVARQAYKPIAERASLLFFVLQDLSSIDYMYQFSLDSYNKLFVNSIDHSQRHEEISHRIRLLNDFHTYAVYKYCCRGLFTRHKILLSLHICAKILEGQQKINIDEYMFLLKGGQIFDRSQIPPNPQPEWITEQMWDNICVLDKYPGFKGLAAQFDNSQRQKEWQTQYFTIGEPENAPVIGELDGTLSQLQKMLILRCIRPDRLIHAISNFVTTNMDARFVSPPPFDAQSALFDSAPQIPLIFILSQGTDPTQILVNFARSHGKSEKLKIVALGQGQQEIATQAFMEGVKKGQWVLLANVHLSIDWLIGLEKMIDDLSTRVTPHKDFRLWLSTFATPQFPVGILQSGIKITTEAPAGLRANMAQAYNYVDLELLNKHQKQSEDQAAEKANPSNPSSLTFDQKDQYYKKLLFGTAYFYALLVERRKFGTLGFNIRYPFSQSDFETSCVFLYKYIDLYDEIPWEALKYLISQIVFGGRLIDDLDRRVLQCYINDLFNTDVTTVPNHKPFHKDLEQYIIPERGTLQEYREFIQNLPLTDHAGVFGQHGNADVFSRTAEGIELLRNMLLIQSTVDLPVEQQQNEKKEGEDGETKKKEENKQQTSVLNPRDERIIAAAQQILATLPSDIQNLPSSIDQNDPNAPMLSVLLQESDRYMKLRAMVQADMTEVQKGVKGLVGMSQRLDEIASNLYLGQLPTSWNQMYKSAKSLAPWSRDFARRIEQLRKWTNDNHPRCIWLGGLSVPTGYLTSLLQQASRKTGIAIDNLEWSLDVTTWTDPLKDVPDGAIPKVGDGTLAMDIILEGAGWDTDNRYLIDSKPMELFKPLPIIKFIPVEIKKKGPKFRASHYECPVYYYPTRTGTREQPSFMLNGWLDSGLNQPDFYVKRGTAMLLNLGD